MFYTAYQILRPILSFSLVVSFAFFFVSLLMIANALMPRSRVTVGVGDVDGDSSKNLKTAMLACIGTFIAGAISLAALYFYN